MIKSSLATNVYPAYSGNYTVGRSKKIRCITIHHTAGKITAKQCGAIFQQVGRYGSSHYGVGYNGEIACFVGEENTAWTNSNWDSNCESITIETSNDQNGGNWHVADITIQSLIRLVADIARRNNLGTLVKGQNVTWHSMFTNTNCPGPYLFSKFDYIIAEANKINNGGNTPTTNFKIGDKVKIGTMSPYKCWIADDVQIINGIYQVREDVNAGGSFDWIDNGVPEECVDITDINGKKVWNSDRIHATKGCKFVFNKTFTIVKTTIENGRTYYQLDYNGNAYYRFWVVGDYLKKV